MPLKYRLYIDESGDHFTAAEHPIGKRYLGLAGVVLRQNAVYSRLKNDLDRLKAEHLEEAPGPFPLHRVDILWSRGPFKVLSDPGRRAGFDRDLLAILGTIVEGAHRGDCTAQAADTSTLTA